MPGFSRRAAAVLRTRPSFVRSVATCFCIGAFSGQALAQIPCDEVASLRAATIQQLVGAADCHQAAGQALRALDALDAALRLASDGDPENTAATITIHARLGQVHAALGDYAKAIDELERGIEIAAAAQRPTDAAPLLNDLGRAYMATDDPLLGLAAFADSRELAATAPLRLTAAVNLARARVEAGSGDNLPEELEADRQRRADSRRFRSEGVDPVGARRTAPRARSELRCARAAFAAGARSRAARGGACADDLGDSRLLADAYGELGAAVRASRRARQRIDRDAASRARCANGRRERQPVSLGMASRSFAAAPGQQSRGAALLSRRDRYARQDAEAGSRRRGAASKRTCCRSTRSTRT